MFFFNVEVSFSELNFAETTDFTENSVAKVSSEFPEQQKLLLFDENREIGLEVGHINLVSTLIRMCCDGTMGDNF